MITNHYQAEIRLSGDPMKEEVKEGLNLLGIAKDVTVSKIKIELVSPEELTQDEIIKIREYLRKESKNQADSKFIGSIDFKFIGVNTIQK